MTIVNDDCCRVSLTFTVLFAYAMANYPCRSAVDYLLFSNRKSTFYIARLVFLTFVIFGVGFLIAVLVPDINIVFGIIGSTAACVFTFFFPPLFYWKTAGFKFSVHTVLCILVFVLGVIIMLVSTTVVILRATYPQYL